MSTTQAPPDRADYMNGKLTHQEYYLSLARFIHAPISMIPQGATRAALKADKNLNNVPLELWDRLDPTVRGCAGRAGIKAWSLSDTVCVMKALARFKITGETK